MICHVDVKSAACDADTDVVTTDRGRVSDEGFTLLELLVVIVILGVLATIVVFAVRGIVDQGEVSALEGDAKTLERAEESYQAMHGTYTDEPGLVAAGFLRDESTLHDITISAGGADYALAAEGAGGGSTTVAPATTAAPPSTAATTTTAPAATTTVAAPPPDETTTTTAAATTTTTTPPGPGEPGGPPLLAEPTSYAGQSGWSFGSTSSPKTLVIIGNGSGAAGQALWQQITSAGTALRVDTQVLWMDQVSTRGEVDAILASSPTYVIVPIQVNLVGGGYAGQYINSLGWVSREDYWWGQQEGGIGGAIAYYIANF
jgi:prepilin-type N-terminal cleavage/methylation domain-containing protein